MQAADLDVVPMPVDAEGLRTDEDDWRERTPRLVYTTPSNQFPTGAVLSISRRLALIDAARRHRAWIIETTTTANSVTPASRSARCTLAPDSPSSISARSARRCFRRCGSVFSCCPTRCWPRCGRCCRRCCAAGRATQLALADFIETGEYGRHLGRMRRLYRDRRRLLMAALDGNLSVPHQIEGGPCGLHLALRLPARYRDRAIVDAARAHGIGPFPLSGFSIDAGSAGNGRARFRQYVGGRVRADVADAVGDRGAGGWGVTCGWRGAG